MPRPSFYYFCFIKTTDEYKYIIKVNVVYDAVCLNGMVQCMVPDDEYIADLNCMITFGDTHHVPIACHFLCVEASACMVDGC